MWTDSTGQHKTEAEFVDVQDGVVRLKKATGEIVSIPIGRLSPECRAYVKTRTAEPKPVAVQQTPLVRLIQHVEPSVVIIKTDRGLGSGFVVHESGLIVTNYHVIEGTTEASATMAGGLSAPIEGYVVANRGKDLALVRLSAKADLKALPLAADVPLKGTEVVAFGAPRGFEFSVTQGIISAVRKGREVQEAIGSEIYRSLGYDVEAAWIQTTAPISPGNSGGPLVSMDGRVVGVNTWGRPDSQNLNFAVAANEIQELLRDRDKPSKRLADLPDLRQTGFMPGRSLGGRRPPRGQDALAPRVAVTLPSGAAIAETQLQIPESWQDRFFPHNAPVYVSKYPSDHVQGVYTFNEGKLHGPAATLYDAGGLQTLAFYIASDRQGPLRLWDEHRQRLLFAEYKRDKKHGVVCLFRGGLPWLIQECDKGNVIQQYLVRYQSGEPKVMAERSLQGDDQTAFASASQRLRELEAEAEEGETQIKKALMAWFRETDKLIKQRRVSVLNPERRDRASDRSRARADANVTNSLWRAALRRSGF